MNIRQAFGLVQGTFQKFNRDKCANLAAALSYYTIFSLSPTLIVVMAILGFVFGNETVQREIYRELTDLLGSQGAVSIQNMIERAYQPREGLIATATGMVMLFVGATGVFKNIQDSLNFIWGVKARAGRAWLRLLRDRLLSFGMLIGIGFLLLVTLVLNASLVALGRHFVSILRIPVYFLQAIEFAFSYGVTAFLFAAIFKFLPDVKIAWRDVEIGALTTALLFTVGKNVIGIYLGNGQVASAYGAAGAIVILIMWVYYSSLILYGGAVFTKVYSDWRGASQVPVEYAERLDREPAEATA